MTPISLRFSSFRECSFGSGSKERGILILKNRQVCIERIQLHEEKKEKKKKRRRRRGGPPFYRDCGRPQPLVFFALCRAFSPDNYRLSPSYYRLVLITFNRKEIHSPSAPTSFADPFSAATVFGNCQPQTLNHSYVPIFSCRRSGRCSTK